MSGFSLRKKGGIPKGLTTFSAPFLIGLIFISAASGAATDSAGSKIGALQSEHGCELGYEYYQPSGTAEVATLILAHGFMRDLSSQRGWAQQWLEHNIATAVVSFCNARLWNGHHRRNADDLIAIRKHLGISNPIYVGFSAGGLAAYLATLQDDAAIGYLGFDSVDSDDLAAQESASLVVPALFLLAPPSACNARNNILPTIERHGYALQSLPQATHCHFEAPFDTRCGWVCGKSEADVAAVQADIFRRATQWIFVTVKGQ